jgi:lysophospholipase L1-like esterase
MRAWLVIGVAAVAATALAIRGCEPAQPAPQPSPPAGLPSVMVALGDSLTSGVGSCGPFRACPDKSWATGTDPQVDSHYSRIVAANPKIKVRATNLAERGARAAGLNAQAAKAVQAKAQYVTVLIGADDACARKMTPVGEFRDEVDDALSTLRSGLPKAKVLVVSIPDLYRLWQIAHTDRLAQIEWVIVGPLDCPSLLTEAVSTARADDRRRRQVADRIDAYNAQLAGACKAYGKRCRWDGGGVHNVQFTLDLVSRYDYFHPNAAGQRKLAEASYPADFDW